MSATLSHDPELAYPSYEKPFLESWNGRFEAVLVVLHPFFSLPDLRPVQEGYVVTPYAKSPSGRAAFHQTDERQTLEPDPVLSEMLKGSSLIASIGHPEGLDWIGDAKPIPWKEIAVKAGLGEPKRVGAALAGLIGRLRNELLIEADVERLAIYSETDAVFLPTEGSFQPLLFEPLLDLLLEDEAVVYQPAFDMDPVRVLSRPDVLAGAAWRGSLYDPHKRRLAVVDWDSHFTLVAGPRAELEHWRSDHALDAFFADETTRHPWWFQPTNLN